jgi:hypothetical protein
MRFEDYPNYPRMHKLLNSMVEGLSQEPENRAFQWKRALQHNKYSMIKIFSDEEQLLRLQSECKRDDSVNADSKSEISRAFNRAPSQVSQEERKVRGSEQRAVDGTFNYHKAFGESNQDSLLRQLSPAGDSSQTPATQDASSKVVVPVKLPSRKKLTEGKHLTLQLAEAISKKKREDK